jgi:peptidyl-prolyl cis-trans isomerase A (cyclophilin A)
MNCFRRFALLAAAPALLSASLLAQQTPSAPPASDLPDSPNSQAPVQLQPDGPTVVFDTSMGRMTCQLFSKQAPNTVANFVGLANGTKDWTDPESKQKMHGKRYYDGTTFHRVIPGFMIQGGDPTGTGMGDPGYLFADELNPDLNFDVPGRLNQGYTIFGQCDPHSVLIVQSIAQVPRDAHDKPLDPVYLNKVTVVEPGQPMPPAPAPAAQPASASTPSPNLN